MITYGLLKSSKPGSLINFQCQYPRRKSLNCHRSVKSETEGFIIAAQDQSIKTINNGANIPHLQPMAELRRNQEG